MEFLRHTLLFCELIAAISSIVFYKYYFQKGHGLKIMPIFLGSLFLSEFLAMLCAYQVFSFSNMLIGNLQILIQVVFYIGLFALNLKKKSAKQAGWVLLFIYVITYLIELVYFNEIANRLNSYSFMIGAMGLIILSVLYLIQSIKSLREGQLLNNVLNWIASGIFISFTVELCVFSLTNYMGDLSLQEKSIIYPIYYIKLVLSGLMYCTFAIGFAYSKWNEQNY